jgi:hypothetical protein
VLTSDPPGRLRFSSSCEADVSPGAKAHVDFAAFAARFAAAKRALFNAAAYSAVDQRNRRPRLPTFYPPDGNAVVVPFREQEGSQFGLDRRIGGESVQNGTDNERRDNFATV